MILRRTVTVALGVAIIAAGCSGEDQATGAGPTTTRTTPTTPGTATPSITVPALPARTTYQPLPGEPAPDVKATAARFLEIASSYAKGDGTVPATQRRLTEAGFDLALATQLGSLLIADAEASGEIVYPQLGGLTETEASVMVVLRQNWRRTSQVATVERTIDLRITRGGEGWEVTGVASLGGEAPAPERTLTSAARQVLAHPRISMPDSAKWDVQAGRVDDRVLLLVLNIAKTRSLAITVFASGHPLNVFASASVSNHTEGRGVDIWAVDDDPVSQLRTDDRGVRAVVLEAIKAGATEVGSPWDLDGSGGASFTNTVHEDHLHLAFDQ